MLWPWDFCLSDGTVIRLALAPAHYLTLVGSLGNGDPCREEAWRYLISGVEALRAAGESGELAPGEWGTVRREGD